MASRTDIWPGGRAGLLIGITLVLAVVAAPAFAEVPEPSISGTPQVGNTLTASADVKPEKATWQWLRCSGDTCAEIAQATASSYLIVDADVGSQLAVRLTLENEGDDDDDGRNSRLSARTATVAAQPPPPPPPPPVITSVAISGTSHVGLTLTASGAANGGTISWQWQRCTTECQDIAGAATPSYTVTGQDAGTSLRVVMTATNAGGSTSQASAAKAVPVPPSITAGPTIPETVRVSETVTGEASWAHGQPGWQWLLCSGTGVDSCSDIVGATERSYAVVAADAGSRLRLRLTVTGAGPADSALSAYTAPIPKPVAPSEPPPANEPFDTKGSSPAPPPAVRTDVVPRLLDPFPIVRIRGRTTRQGARVSLLSVRAPRGARIDVRCKGRHCPRRRVATSARLRRLTAYERHLRAGVTLVIRVTQAQRIGKYTRFVIRRAAPPLRRDACLAPGSKRPTACPAA